MDLLEIFSYLHPQSWSQIVSDMTNVSNVVLHNQGDIRGHGEGHLGRQAAGLGEHVQVPCGEGKGDWLLHLDADSFLLLVNICSLCQLNVANTDVSSGRELDSLLGAGDDH